MVPLLPARQHCDGVDVGEMYCGDLSWGNVSSDCGLAVAAGDRITVMLHTVQWQLVMGLRLCCILCSGHVNCTLIPEWVLPIWERKHKTNPSCCNHYDVAWALWWEREREREMEWERESERRRERERERESCLAAVLVQIIVWNTRGTSSDTQTVKLQLYKLTWM